jgi:cell division septal protein FtsQ
MTGKKGRSMASKGPLKPGFTPRKILLPAAVAAAAAAFVYIWFFSGWLSVKKINLYGRRELPVDSLRVITQQYVGRNILTVPLGQLEADFLRHRDIASVSFRKRYPDRLDCYLSERKPVAAVVCGEMFEVDENGVVLSGRISSGGVDLPLITGVESLEAEEGKRTLGKALEALRIFREYGFSPAKQLSEIHIEDGEIILIWLEVGSIVRVGKENLEERIRKLKSIYHFLEREESFPEMVDLRFRHQVIVR